jgi:signal transduction histidine kinase
VVHIEKLVRLTDAINGISDARALTKKIAEEGARLCGTDLASVYIYSDEQELERTASVGLSQHLAREIEKLGRAQWAVNNLVASNKPRIARTVAQAPYPSPLHKLAASEGIAAIISVPMIYQDKLMGILLVFQTVARDITEDTENDLYVLGNYAALALAHLHLVEIRMWEQKSQDQFLDVLGHELRTPLTSIMGFTQMIRRRFNTMRETDPRLRDQLDLLWAQAQRLHRLLDTFIDMSNIERGEFTIEHDKLDVVAALNMAAEQSQAQARSKHQLRLEIPDHSIWVSGDAKRLEHAFIHVISNAIRYSPVDQPIVVACKERNRQEIQISVVDHGPGIPSELRREIFKRFYPSDTRKAGGMGMGLYFSRAIVEAHGGKLSIDSTPGSGTTVDIVLPVE